MHACAEIVKLKESSGNFNTLGAVKTILQDAGKQFKDEFQKLDRLVNNILNP